MEGFSRPGPEVDSISRGLSGRTVTGSNESKPMVLALCWRPVSPVSPPGRSATSFTSSPRLEVSSGGRRCFSQWAF